MTASVNAAGPAATLFSGAEFEAPLQSFHAGLRESAPQRAAQSELNRLSWDSLRLRDDFARLAREVPRLRAILRRPDGGTRHDVLQFSWRLGLFTRDLAELERRAVRAHDAAVKDPALVKLAERFLSNARWLRSDTRWLEMDFRLLPWDLRAAGLWFEAQDFERYSRDIESGPARVERAAGEILRRVRG